MKTKIAAILVMIGILITAVVGCSSAEAATNIPKNTHKNFDVSIDNLMLNKQIVRNIELNLGDTLTLTVDSNPSTGFKWTEQTQISDKAIIEQTLHEFVEPAANMIGAAGKEVWTYKTLKTGTTEISAEYGRPWVGGEKAEWTIDLSVSVK